MDRNNSIPTGRYIILIPLAIISIFTSCAAQSGQKAKPVSSVPVKPETAVKNQLADKTWLLAGYQTATLFVPLEPGNGTTAWILFNADGSLNGTTGINDFTGTWTMKKKNTEGTYAISISIAGLTKKAAPNEIAAKFEQDLIRQYKAATLLKTGKDSIQLLNGRNEILIQCIYRTSGLAF